MPTFAPNDVAALARSWYKRFGKLGNCELWQLQSEVGEPFLNAALVAMEAMYLIRAHATYDRNKEMYINTFRFSAAVVDA